MKVNLEKIEISDFNTPNFVLRALAGGPTSETEAARSIPLSAVCSADLLKLCDKFKADVFKKAGKDLPPSVGFRS